jgi:MurNAc alpha-1-phosphate uridylyltransferase
MTASKIAMPKRAIVLAAGLGTRMRPYSNEVPKPLVKVSGKALIDYALDRLDDVGVDQAVVNVHYMADALEGHIKKRKRPRVIISDERKELMGTGGGVVKALSHLGDAPFFYMNSDTLWIEGVKPNLLRLAEASTRRRWTRFCCSRQRPPASATTRGATSP